VTGLLKSIDFTAKRDVGTQIRDSLQMLRRSLDSAQSVRSNAAQTENIPSVHALVPTVSVATSATIIPDNSADLSSKPQTHDPVSFPRSISTVTSASSPVSNDAITTVPSTSTAVVSTSNDVTITVPKMAPTVSTPTESEPTASTTVKSATTSNIPITSDATSAVSFRSLQHTSERSQSYQRQQVDNDEDMYDDRFMDDYRSPISDISPNASVSLRASTGSGKHWNELLSGQLKDLDELQQKLQRFLSADARSSVQSSFSQRSLAQIPETTTTTMQPTLTSSAISNIAEIPVTVRTATSAVVTSVVSSTVSSTAIPSAIATTSSSFTPAYSSTANHHTYSSYVTEDHTTIPRTIPSFVSTVSKPPTAPITISHAPLASNMPSYQASTQPIVQVHHPITTNANKRWERTFHDPEMKRRANILLPNGIVSDDED